MNIQGETGRYFLARQTPLTTNSWKEKSKENPSMTEARLQSSLMQQMVRTIWFEELLRE
jgi:hypothetical protein